MLTKKITDGIYYVGANDRTTTRFEGLWPLPYGVSYNSYLVAGNDKTAIIDGVEISHAFEQIAQIKKILHDNAPDYLIVNHMEPDHTGAVQTLRAAFPNLTIVGNAKTIDMLKGYYGICDGTLTVADGDTIDLGGKTLKFALTPMVHWPETMMTYAVENKTLFSGDAFGCFGALNGGIIDEEMDTSLYFPEMTRYYSNIVGKYGLPVQKALQKLSGVAVDYICSTHGPVWHSQAAEVIGIYDRLSKGESENGVVIAYASMGTPKRWSRHSPACSRKKESETSASTTFRMPTSRLSSATSTNTKGLSSHRQPTTARSSPASTPCLSRSRCEA